jgi:hypothetical protein
LENCGERTTWKVFNWKTEKKMEIYTSIVCLVCMYIYIYIYIYCDILGYHSNVTAPLECVA